MTGLPCILALPSPTQSQQYTCHDNAQTPYAVGISQASCGIYGKTRMGFVPMLPVLKLVPLLPIDPTEKEHEGWTSVA